MNAPDLKITPLEVTLTRSERWMIHCSSRLTGPSFETTNRLRVAISLLQLAIEHHQAIHVLVEQGLNGSAFALLRPLYEAYVRGVWFHHCASDKQILSFLTGIGTNLPDFGGLIAAIEKVDGFEGGVLSDIKKTAWKNMNDFTHGGAIQVKARNSRDEVVSNFLPEHVKGILESATAFSLMASLAIASAVKDETLSNDLFQTYLQIQQ